MLSRSEMQVKSLKLISEDHKDQGLGNMVIYTTNSSSSVGIGGYTLLNGVYTNLHRYLQINTCYDQIIRSGIEYQ